MKFSKYISKAVTPVMALFQKQHGCLSNKATTICGHSAESLRQVPVRHNRGGKFTENKVRFAPPTMCRLTIDQIMYADKKNETWKPYVARHRAIYEYKICKNIDRAEQVLQNTIHELEVTPLRIKYDIYFELAEIYRIKEKNSCNYDKSLHYYLESIHFATRVHDYNLESNAQLGLMLLKLKYNYKIEYDVLRAIISKTHEICLNINYNYALYVKYLVDNESIPKELVLYWSKMHYSDLLSLSSKSKSEKCNLKLTVM